MVGFAIYYFASDFLNSSGKNINVPTAVARVTTLVDKVVEQGVLESQSTVNGNCEIDDHENKIIFLEKEGLPVKKGQIVAKFDDSEIKEEINERQMRVNEATAAVETAKQELVVQKDENETSLRTARQTLTFADLDLKKYLEGDYKVKKSEIEQGISEAQTAVDQANRDMQNTRALVKRGFREYQQLEEAKQVVKSANLKLINAKQKLATLEEFEHVKTSAEFEGKAVEAKHALAIAETTAKAKLAKAKDALKNAEAGLKIQKNRLKEQQKDLERHVMKAPQDGNFTLARNDWRGNGEKLHEGAVVYRNQPVFILPDMKRMQVKVGIHETLVSKVKEGQKAIIKVDAFSGVAVSGVVKAVSQMSASTRWERSNNYSVIVTIDSFPDDIVLKPGMNAEVEIHAGRYEDRLAVPIQAVTSFGRKKYVFKQTSDGEFKATEVETEKSTISFVAIESGLEKGDVVALDAYQRGLVEFDEEDSEKMLELEIDEMENSDAENSDAAGDVKPLESAKIKELMLKAGMTSEESGAEVQPETSSESEGSGEMEKESDSPQPDDEPESPAETTEEPKLDQVEGATPEQPVLDGPKLEEPKVDMPELNAASDENSQSNNTSTSHGEFVVSSVEIHLHA